MDGRGLWQPHDVERDGLMMRVAAEAANFEIEVTGIEGAERRRWLRWPAIAEHPLIPRFAGKPVGFLAGSGGALSRGPDGRAENGRVIWSPSGEDAPVGWASASR